MSDMGQRRSNAAMKDVQNRYRKEDCVPNTERRDIVAMKDVPIMCRMEEFVSGMVHHGQERLVAIKDVPHMQLREEYVSNTVQSKRGGYAVIKDAPMLLSMEEYVSDMVPKLRLAAMKVVPIKQRMEKFVSGTVHHGQQKLVAIKDVPNTRRME